MRGMGRDISMGTWMYSGDNEQYLLTYVFSGEFFGISEVGEKKSIYGRFNPFSSMFTKLSLSTS